MFLLNAQNSLYIILSSYVGHVKKKSSLNSMSLIGFQVSKISMFFGKFTANQVMRSFSDRINSLEPPVFEFTNGLPYGLEESGESRALISWILGK